MAHSRKQIVALSVFGVIVASLGAAAGIYYARQARLEEVPPRRGDVVEAVYGIGTVETDDHFVLRSAISAGVRDVYVVEGQEIPQDKLLATLDTGAAYRSPISGHVTDLNIQPGETINMGQTLLEIENLSRTYIRLLLDQESTLRVEPGQNVSITFESVRGTKYSGTVKFVYPSGGQFVVRIDADTLPDQILPGMAADLAIEVGRRKGALLIPVTALQNGTVVRTRDGKRKRIQLEIGAIESGWAEVVSGDLTVDDALTIRRKR